MAHGLFVPLAESKVVLDVEVSASLKVARAGKRVKRRGPSKSRALARQAC